MKKLLLLLFSLLISFNAYGEYTEIYEDYDGDAHYIDFDTIKERDGYIYWWELMDFNKPIEGFKSIWVYQQGDCGMTRTKLLSMVDYREPMGEGDSKRWGSDEWQYRCFQMI